MSQVEDRVPRCRSETGPLPAPPDAETRELTATRKMANHERNNDIIERQVQIANRMGLHARPAMQFVDVANKFACRITVSKNKQCVNAKSIMELLLLAAGAGTVLTIRAEGFDAPEAVEALVKLVESKFGEE